MTVKECNKENYFSHVGVHKSVIQREKDRKEQRERARERERRENVNYRARSSQFYRVRIRYACVKCSYVIYLRFTKSPYTTRLLQINAWKRSGELRGLEFFIFIFIYSFIYFFSFFFFEVIREGRVKKWERHLGFWWKTLTKTILAYSISLSLFRFKSIRPICSRAEDRVIDLKLYIYTCLECWDLYVYWE